jgi:hypothetical protein
VDEKGEGKIMYYHYPIKRGGPVLSPIKTGRVYEARTNATKARVVDVQWRHEQLKEMKIR